MSSTEEKPGPAVTVKDRVDLDMLRSNLNFSTTGSVDDYDPPMKKSRQARDPMSHRIIEKRRRDRMNNCLADLSQLIPQHYLKQGQGRIEKTEIIEMAISHIRNIKQLYVNSLKIIESNNADMAERFWLGYKEAMDEVMRYLVEKMDYSPTHKLCIELRNHLQTQSQQYKPEDSGAKKASPTEMMSESQTSSGIGSLISDVSSTDSGNQGQSTLTLIGSDEIDKGLNIQKNNGELSLSRGVAGGENIMDAESLSLTSGSCSSSTTGGNGNGSQTHDAQPKTPSPTGFKECRSDPDLKQGTGYNFKKYIKLRFTEGAPSKGFNMQASDSVSVSSYDESDFQDVKVKKDRVPSPGSESIASQYPNSVYSSNSGNASNENMSSSDSPKGQSSSQTERSSSSSTPSEEDGINNWSAVETSNVPGFVLHPDSNFYIPIIINTQQFMPYLKQYENLNNAMTICHPVSIPVNFSTGHFMSYQVMGPSASKPLKTHTPLRNLTSSRASHSYNHLHRHSHSRASSHDSPKQKDSDKKIPNSSVLVTSPEYV